MDLRDLGAVRRAVDQAFVERRVIEEAMSKLRLDLDAPSKALSAIAAEGALVDKAMRMFAADTHALQERIGGLVGDVSRISSLSEEVMQSLGAIGLSDNLQCLTGSLEVGRLGPEFAGGMTTLAGDVQKFAQEWQASLDSVSNAFVRLSLFPDPQQLGHLMAGLVSVPTLQTTALTELAAKTSLEYLPWERLGETAGLSGRARRRLERSTRRLRGRYADLTSRPDRSEGEVDALASEASVGVLAHGQALRVISTKASTDVLVIGIDGGVVRATFDCVEESLAQVDAGWVEMLHGARERAANRGPDWARHWAASYRQLVKNVLHTAAPSAVVKRWDSSDLDSNGHPTWRTKVRWLCRNKGKTERTFLVEDIDSALRIVAVLNEAVHADSADMSEREFRWLSLRIEKALHDVLRLWERK